MMGGFLRRSPEVLMLVSVNDPPLVAGEKYRLEPAVADRMIAMGYAAGKLSGRNVPPPPHPPQVVTFDG